MRYFFIDLENVRSYGLEGVLSLDKDDFVFIFYSENANNLTIPTLENINNSKASVKFINTNFVGSNAMDFQIVSLLGAMIERNKQGFFSIISHDNGFNSAITFCERYFSEYPIRLGKFDNIISALAYDLKQTGANKEAGNAPLKKKKQNGKHAAGVAGDDKAAITGRKDKAHSEAEDQNGKKPQGGDDANPTQEQAQKKQKTNSNRRNKKPANAAKTEQNGEVSVPVTAGPDMKYIYDYLKDILSTKTIDIHASRIHEGLLISDTKEELHNFFRNKCGVDEGEALYMLLQSDFEYMKRRARK